MARIKISSPTTSLLYSHEFQVPINMINYGGHLGNDSFLTIAHEARIYFLKSLSFTELNFFGLSLIQSDSAVMYKKEVLHTDILEISIFIEDVHARGFDFLYILKDKSTQAEVSRIKTGMLFFNYEKKKLERTPQEFMDRFNNL